MATFNTGYETGRQGCFTRSGTIQPLRLARPARCRRFRPSPCPTHSGWRLATMPSADCCPITPDVTARRAARVTSGSGNNSSAFALALRPAPVATAVPSGFDGDTSPIGPALSSTRIAARTARGTDFSVTHPCSTQKPGFGILPSRSKQRQKGQFLRCCIDLRTAGPTVTKSIRCRRLTQPV